MVGLRIYFQNTSRLYTFRYSEVGLKGRQRGFWEFILKNNIDHALRSQGVHDFLIFFHQKRGYLVLYGDSSVNQEKDTVAIQVVDDIALRVLLNTPGIKWAGRLVQLYDFVKEGKQHSSPNEADILSQVSDRIAKLFPVNKLIDIEVKRYYKGFTYTSDRVKKELKKLILANRGEFTNISNDNGVLGGDVNVDRASSVLYILLEDDGIYATLRYDGIGGLPVSSTGKGVVLFSGGIDSPVAAYYAFKRGIRADLLHFAPSVEGIERTKIYGLYILLRQYNPYLKLYVTSVPRLGRLLHRGKVYNPVVVFRRLLIRFGIELLLKVFKGGFLVTGDNLGQVASQTFSNLLAQNSVLCERGLSHKVAFYRPLIGFDKEEIIYVAKQINTYDLSIQEYSDCCTLINKGSKTTTRIERVQEWEADADIDSMLAEAWDNLVIIK